MARVFVLGSSTGLGLMAGQHLSEQGHEVVLHARNERRADDARRELPQAAMLVVGDLSTIAGARSVAEQVNMLGRFDAVIHNAAVGYQEPFQKTADGLPHLFSINTLSAYILTAMIERPRRLVYMSSGMHKAADANLDDIVWRRRSWRGSTAYSESKLHDAILALMGRAAVGGCEVERGRTRMGRDENGRPRRAGRSAERLRDAGMARGGRRSSDGGLRKVFLSPPTARAQQAVA